MHVYGLFALLAALLLPPHLGAQNNTASLSGLVTDQSNAAVAHVLLKELNAATGYSREAETDASGHCNFQDLPIGEYTITVSRKDFDSIEEQVQLGTAEKVRRDFVLRVGASESKVEVTADPANLSPDDASIGAVIDTQTIQETPLYLRNWDDLLRMVAGAQISRYTQQSGATSATLTLSATGRAGNEITGTDCRKTLVLWTGFTPR